MDKRTLLAFGLIGIVIFLMPHYFRWINPPPVEYPFQIESSQIAPIDDLAPKISAPEQVGSMTRETNQAFRESSPSEQRAQPVISSPDFDVRSIRIETQLYTATISTRGGLITSWQLKEHADRFGGQLELIGPGRGGLTTRMSGRSLDDLEFVSSSGSLYLEGTEQAELTLTASVDEKRITKRIRFQGDRYRTEVALSAEGLTAQDWLSIGWDGALAQTEANSGEDEGMYGWGATDRIVTLVGEEIEDWTTETINEEDVSMPSGRNVSWVVTRNAYFAASLMPRSEVIYDVHLAGSTQDGASHYATEIKAQYPGEPIQFGIMIGPLSYDILEQQEIDLYGRPTAANLSELVQFGWAFIRPVLRPMTILCIHAFSALHNVLPNYGFVIIVFSVLVKVFLFPLTRKSTESMARMQELQPEIAALREKYASDQTKLNTETMKLYKDKKVNPLGGCLPMFLQAPIMFSLFNLFRNAIELRQAGFVWWITDLSKPETLLVYGFDIHILPLLMSGAMFVQQKMTMKDPKQAAMVYIMPVFMIWIFWSMSSGLVLYFTMYNLLSLFEQQALKRFKMDPENA
jgi:YidC/Oxa1 family membrane protein insertase